VTSLTGKNRLNHKVELHQALDALCYGKHRNGIPASFPFLPCLISFRQAMNHFSSFLLYHDLHKKSA
ncbi:hypothetical protein, partial [Dialister sp.]|uniref:hypothetical protein n=1 Tax=Dialister sp. TaxID=1955814 RepID=UPI003F063297